MSKLIVIFALFVAALQPIPEFGRVYAAYRGVFIDGFRPDRYSVLEAMICVVGVLVMVGPSRG